MIKEFRGQYSFLSNFWPAEVEFEGSIYPTAEHAYQAAKSLDPEVRVTIRILLSTVGAKRYGRDIDIRPDWNKVRVGIMEQIVRDKFTRNPELGQKLLETGDQELVEGNTWNDTFWGVCKGNGENNLGKILMKIRTELNAPMV